MTLNPKQLRFAQEYCVDLNATQAALRAGYSPKTAYAQGSRLLKHDEVASEISRRMAKSQQKAELSIERLDLEIARLAYFDPRQLYRPDGTLKLPHELDDDTAAAIASMDIDQRTITTGRGRNQRTRTIIKTTKAKAWGKNEALTLAARRLGALQDNLKHSGTIKLEELIGESYGEEKGPKE